LRGWLEGLPWLCPTLPVRWSSPSTQTCCYSMGMCIGLCTFPIHVWRSRSFPPHKRPVPHFSPFPSYTCQQNFRLFSGLLHQSLLYSTRRVSRGCPRVPSLTARDRRSPGRDGENRLVAHLFVLPHSS
jgi:hypothetical protein